MIDRAVLTFRMITGEFGHHASRRRHFENGRFIPVSAVPGGRLIPSPGRRARTSGSVTMIRALFVCLVGLTSSGCPGPGLDVKMGTGSLLDPVQGGLWLGFCGGWCGVLQGWSDPRIVRRTRWVRRGPGHRLQLDRDGALWAATEGGLSRVKNGRVATLTSRNGLPCDTVHWVMEDDDHSFWLYTACGLVRIARPDLDAWVSRFEADVPGYGSRQFRRSQEPFADGRLQPAGR